MFASPQGYMPSGSTNNVGFYNQNAQGGNFAHVENSAHGPFFGTNIQSHSGGGKQGGTVQGGASYNSDAYQGGTTYKGGASFNGGTSQSGTSYNGGAYQSGASYKRGASHNSGANQGGANQGGAQLPYAQQQTQVPAFGPPNSIPCANGTSAWCKRCGAPNDIRAPKCDTCNLQLLEGGYPSEPPPGNNGGNQYKGGTQSAFNHNGVSYGGGAPYFNAPYNSGAQHNGAQYNGGAQHNNFQSGGAHLKGGGKSGGKGAQVKWCQDCGQQNPHFHRWCNTCHSALPHSGKGNPSSQVSYTQPQHNGAFHQSALQGDAQQRGTMSQGGAQHHNGTGTGGFLKGGKYFPGGANPQSHAISGPQQPYNLDSQRFIQESSLYPGRIPRCFEVGFEAGQYIAPVNLSSMAQWKTNCEYLNHIKMIQSKVETYKDFLKNVEMKLLSCALPAWKHHKELESSMQNLPDAAKGLHTPPLHLLAELMFDQINDDEKKSAFETLVVDILKDQASPTPPASPMPRQQPPDENQDQHMEAINIDDSFEIPQWVPAQDLEVLDPSEIEYLREMEEELTPCLPKRQRMFCKTPHNIAALGKSAHLSVGPPAGKDKGNATIPPNGGNVSGSSDDDSEAKLTKREKKAAAKQRKKEALAAASPATPSNARKSIIKPKKS